MARPTDAEAANKALAHLLAVLTPSAADASSPSGPPAAAATTTSPNPSSNPDLARALAALASSRPSPPNSTAPPPPVQTAPVASTSRQQPTRSGRVPRLPNPAELQADPFSFVELPSESESDDPDFKPESITARQARRMAHAAAAAAAAAAAGAGGGAEGAESPWAGMATESEVDWAGTGTGADADPFGFGTILNNPDATDFLQSFSLGHLAGGGGTGQSPEWTGIGSTPAADAFMVGPGATGRAGVQQPVSAPGSATKDRPSPLTAASLAGIPFVNVALPDSDDSPEFLPPAKRARRERAGPTDRDSRRGGSVVAGSDVSPRRGRSGYVIDPGAAADEDEDGDEFATASATGLGVPQTAQDAAISRNNPPVVVPSSAGQASAAIPPIARVSHSHRPDPRETGPKDEQGRPLLTKRGLPRRKTGPKPTMGREERMEKKKMAMRDNRARNKEYVEDLEARVLELEEENARLREENDQLLRESRENWRNRALGLPDGITQPSLPKPDAIPPRPAAGVADGSDVTMSSYHQLNPASSWR